MSAEDVAVGGDVVPHVFARLQKLFRVPHQSRADLIRTIDDLARVTTKWTIVSNMFHTKSLCAAQVARRHRRRLESNVV